MSDQKQRDRNGGVSVKVINSTAGTKVRAEKSEDGLSVRLIIE